MIAVGSDHGGYLLKEQIKLHLLKNGHEVVDVGCNSELSVDYPDYAKKVCELVTNGQARSGILVCGTGIGMCIAANKQHGIRAALCSDCFSARATREHNDANVLCLGERVVGQGLALLIVDEFVNTPFSYDARHERRISKLEC